jgi:hypothetical protein
VINLKRNEGSVRVETPIYHVAGYLSNGTGEITRSVGSWSIESIEQHGQPQEVDGRLISAPVLILRLHIQTVGGAITSISW